MRGRVSELEFDFDLTETGKSVYGESGHKYSADHVDVGCREQSGAQINFNARWLRSNCPNAGIFLREYNFDSDLGFGSDVYQSTRNSRGNEGVVVDYGKLLAGKAD